MPFALPLLLACAAAAGDGAPAVHRHEGPLEKVLEDAAAKERPVLLEFHREPEPACRWMDREVYADAAVAALLDGSLVDYRLVDGKGESGALAERFKVRTWPTLVFLDAEGNELEREEGVVGKVFLLSVAQDVADGTHLRGLRKRVDKRPDDPALRTKLGLRLLLAGDPGARVHLDRALELDPKKEKESTKEAAFLVDVLEARAAGTVGPLRAFLERYPDCCAAVKVHEDLIQALDRRHDTLGQIPSWEFLVARSPSPERLNGLAWSLARNGKEPERALSLVEEALKEAPDSAAFVDTKAECLSRLGRHDEALEAQRKAISMLTSSVPAARRKEFEDHLAEIEERKAGEKKK